MKRNLCDHEARFLGMLLARSPQGESYRVGLSSALVEPMDDGEMGSLTFLSTTEGRCIGRELCSAEFLDADGIPVIATINLDNYGDLFELDIWKADFSPLTRFPECLPK